MGQCVRAVEGCVGPGPSVKKGVNMVNICVLHFTVGSQTPPNNTRHIMDLYLLTYLLTYPPLFARSQSSEVDLGSPSSSEAEHVDRSLPAIGASTLFERGGDGMAWTSDTSDSRADTGDSP